MRRLATLFAVVLALPMSVAAVLQSAAVAQAAEPVHISACFTTVAAGRSAVLDNDLACASNAGNPVPNVSLESGGRLQLDGHTISGGDIGVAITGGKGLIEGPGMIAGAADVGVLAEGVTVLRDLTLDGNGNGVYSRYHHPVKLSGVTVRNSTHYGVTLGPSAINNGRIKGTDVTVVDNGAIGVNGTVVKLRNLQATGNGYSGVLGALKVIIVDGTVTGNGAAGLSAYEQVDIASFTTRPKLREVTCDHSSNDVGDSWGVCALDP